MTHPLGLLPAGIVVHRNRLPIEGVAAALTFCGVRLFVDGDRVKWHAPNGAMTVAMLRQIKARETELAALLRRDPSLGEPTHERNS